MKKQQFGERQYETAVNIELALGAATPFVPTQNIEFYLGFDAAHNPRGAHAIWRILSVRHPRRIAMSPNLWPNLPHRFHDEVPGTVVSLFVQYKVPVFQDSPRAKYFSRIGNSYYHVRITSHQQRRLMKLEDRVRRRAVVRYASPAFWSRADFDKHDEKHEVLKHSAFIAPSLVKSHRSWMYPNETSPALLNPEPEEANGEVFEALIRVLTERSQRESLRQHVAALAQAFAEETGVGGEEEGEASWIARLRRYGNFSDDDISLLTNLSRVAIACDDRDLMWTILLSPDKGWEFLRNELPVPPFHWWRWIHLI